MDTKKRMKLFKKIITLLSLLGIFFFKRDIYFFKLYNNLFLVNITEILYDISICIFSAMILVWGIDEVNNRMNEKEEKKRHDLIFSKLIPVLSEYYEFYLKLYIYTRKDKVSENQSVLESLASCKDELVSQIIKTNPFYKPGFYADPIKSCAQTIAFINNNSDLDKVLQEDTTVPIYKCWSYDTIKFYNEIEQIEKTFLELFPNDLLIKVDILLELVKPLTSLSDVVEMKLGILPFNIQISKEMEFPVDVFLREYKLIAVLEKLEEVMMYIESKTGKKLRARDIKFFNDRNEKPVIGELYK